MADIAITAASVQPPSNYQPSFGTAGETLTAGQLVYLKASDQRWWKADCTGLEKSGNATFGNLKVTLGGAAAGQPVGLLDPKNSYTVGGTGSVGRIFYLSATAGGGNIAPVADLVNGNYLVPLGYFTTSTIMYFDPDSTGVILA